MDGRAGDEWSTESGVPSLRARRSRAARKRIERRLDYPHAQGSSPPIPPRRNPDNSSSDPALSGNTMRFAEFDDEDDPPSGEGGGGGGGGGGDRRPRPPTLWGLILAAADARRAARENAEHAAEPGGGRGSRLQRTAGGVSPPPAVGGRAIPGAPPDERPQHNGAEMRAQRGLPPAAALSAPLLPEGAPNEHGQVATGLTSTRAVDCSDRDRPTDNPVARTWSPPRRTPRRCGKGAAPPRGSRSAPSSASREERREEVEEVL
jgi:hypothetical protein